MKLIFLPFPLEGGGWGWAAPPSRTCNFAATAAPPTTLQVDGLLLQAVNKIIQLLAGGDGAKFGGPRLAGSERPGLQFLLELQEHALEVLHVVVKCHTARLINVVPAPKDLLVHEHRDVAAERLGGHTGGSIVDVGDEGEAGLAEGLLQPIEEPWGRGVGVG